MPSVVHVVTTGKFAGVERYVCNTAAELAGRGWDVTVIGGDARHMPSALGREVPWLPGATPFESLRSLIKLGRQDICHAHMTLGEAVAMVTAPRHRSAIVSTRHFAARRGSNPLGRIVAPLISASLDRQIAVTDFVAENIERPPETVIRNGIPPLPRLWQASSRVVLVLQRLEREKDTLTALRAWRESGMFEESWSLRVVGDGAERAALESWVATEGVQGVIFTGWTSDVEGELARAGMLLAPAPSDSFGFGVLEAMSAGVPVVASASGGHLETIGRLPNAPLFSAGDAGAAAAALRSLASDARRSALSSGGTKLVFAEFTVELHVDRLLAEYEAVLRTRRKRLTSESRNKARDRRVQLVDMNQNGALRELVVCSLEAWDDVRRRNQFFVDVLLRRYPALRVLFIEPAADPIFDLWTRRTPTSPRLRTIAAGRRLRAFRPLKVFPRKAGPVADAFLRTQVRVAARLMGFSRPTLWINDVTYAPLAKETGWPSLYDVTDDWLLAPFAPREIERLRRLDGLAIQDSDEVVVCSPALATSRGAHRPVSLIPNGVDIEHFRRTHPRPHDLPQRPIAVYVGSLHEARIDIKLVAELARALPHVNVVLVGPNSLAGDSLTSLTTLPNVYLLGPRPYDGIPAYLQHADVIIVPHQVSPFTESLDPIKAYECLVVETPTVATPVAGFRAFAQELNVVERGRFVARVAEVLDTPVATLTRTTPPDWESRALAFADVLSRATAAAR